jgi:hypothetical protein
MPAATQRSLERAYVEGRFEVRPIVEAILRHPLFHTGPRMVIPPVVFTAGILRGSRQTITTTSWAWIAQLTGQVLFQPPNVSGWNYAQWLDTSRWAGRLTAVNQALTNYVLDKSPYPYGDSETNHQALARALGFWGDPDLSAETRGRLLGLGRRIVRGQTAEWQLTSAHNIRQNAFRTLIPMSNDFQTC